MSDEPASTLLEYVHRMARGHEYADVPDGLLLNNFVAQHDDSAFSALVQRHGQMVWGGCRRMLYSQHDTEDAFQATFLVLARKAASIIPPGMVANWLHGVAYQTALKARSITARRRRKEVQVQELPEPTVEGNTTWSDVRSLIDEELRGLPDRHRAAVVLCDLEGNTRSEAARHLGVPEGTIAGWLSRGRAKLARRLTQRGVALPSGGVALVLSHSAASGQVPVALVYSTTKAAIAFAVQSAMPTGTISSQATVLTKGVIKSMFFHRLKLPLVCLVMCVVGMAGMALAHFSGANPDDKKAEATEQPLKKPKVDGASDDLTAKLKGKWINVNEKSGMARRITIENKDDNDKTNQGWTVTTRILEPVIEQDWQGERLKLHMMHEVEGGAKNERRVVCGFATWVRMVGEKKEAEYYMTFRMNGELLMVETCAIYTGKFFPQHWQCEYKKEK